MKNFNYDDTPLKWDKLVVSDTRLDEFKKYFEAFPSRNAVGMLFGIQVYVSQFLPDNVMMFMLGDEIVKIVKFVKSEKESILKKMIRFITNLFNRNKERVK